VNRRTLGLLATVIGSALGAWWLTTQQRSRFNARNQTPRERGTVIFDNTPAPSAGGDAII
jgi:hypothetical protein